MEETSVAKNVEMRVQLMFPDIHTKEFQCPTCAKYFSRKFTLDAHMLIHKGEKPHACPFCGKCFRQKGTLMRHKALHSTKNLFHCSLCNRGFRQKNVFIHHLRHRHNVSVETLDRRKYRTELKDYQSIMDTLPPFVHADSTAIASSEKHFDALLFESIKKPAGDSAELLQEEYSTGSTLQNAQTNVLDQPHHSESLFQMKKVNLFANNCDNLHLNVHCNRSDHKEEIIFDQENSDDIKPVNSHFSEMKTTVPSVNSPHIFSCRTLNTNSKNQVSPETSNITSSNESNIENLICIPCQQSFTSESEFKCHVKTHVQSVLMGDVNSLNHRSSDIQKSVDADSYTQLKDGSTSPVNVLEPVSSIIPRSLSNCTNISISKGNEDETVLPVKLEILDSEMENSLTPNKSEFKTTLTSPSRKNLSDSELKCPVCDIILQGEEAFRNHSKQHDSFTLLKLICELHRRSLIDQNQVSSSNASHTNCKRSFSNIHFVKSHKDLKEIPCRTTSQFTKPVKKCKMSKNIKSVSKSLMCVQCNKRFSSKLLFEYHRQLHLRSKGFYCKCCKKDFSSKQLLLSHTRIYHLRAFTCFNCYRTFSYRKLFQFHHEKCKSSVRLETSKGSCMDFPVVNIESLLSSDIDGIVGIIPIGRSSLSGGIKLGIPVMSVSRVTALYTHQREV